jgi:hypothetical protein
MQQGIKAFLDYSFIRASTENVGNWKRPISRVASFASWPVTLPAYFVVASVGYKFEAFLGFYVSFLIAFGISLRIYSGAKNVVLCNRLAKGIYPEGFAKAYAYMRLGTVLAFVAIGAHAVFLISTGQMK